MGRRQKKTPALKIKAGVLLCCRPPAKLIHGVQSEVQAGQYACVFASVSAAVNSVCDEQIWTQHTLFDAWKKQGVDQVHFGNIARVATEPVRDRVQA